MDDAPQGWWREHGLTVLILLVAFSLALTIRSLFAWSTFQQYGWLYVYGGGSDSFYHSRVMAYIIQNHTNLGWDYGLRYPVGAPNPREPLFDWMNAVLGILFAGFFPASTGQSSAVVAGSFFLDLQAPLWAGLGVFPVYLLGKEVSSKRMGLVAAMIFPFMTASIESSGLGYANYLTFYTFVMLLTVYAYIRMIKAAGHRRWIASYRRPREFLPALRQFLRYDRVALRWAVFTGVCMGALALSWQGYTFFIAALVVFLAIQMIVERIRRVDSFSMYVLTWIVGIIGFAMAVPYYYPQGLFLNWFFQPMLVYFGALIILLPFLFLRDAPWVISIPVLLATFAVAVGGLFLVDPNTFITIVTGQGYFVKTLVYSTVAEAQAPSVDSLIIGFGVLTFFVSFVGLALFALKLARQRFRREHTMFIAFAVLSVYLPITAAKFFLLGSAVFALLPAEVILLIMGAAGYDQLRRNISSLSDRRGQLSALRRTFKARHVLVLGLVMLLIVPNIWIAVDAGIPYNEKSGYDQQIYYTFPAPLRPAASQASSFYLGAAGNSLDTPNQYDEAGYNWLATQDTNLPLAQRPAFISWWDYGFQALGEGLHPTVADNFQNGIDPAGAFLLSQNESQAIAVLAVELLASEQRVSGQPYLPAGLNAVLAHDGVNLAELHTLMVNTSLDVPLVIAHPERYLPVSASNLDPTNAMYMATSWFLADSFPISGVSQVYNDIQAYTGWSIRYAMVDSRLFPFSGSNTGIFYAPADLTDRVIGSGGVPSTFFNVTVVGSNGITYPLGQSPASVQIASYNINYFAPFYDTMLYHIYMGYNGTDISQGAGIPGLTGSLTNYNPEPGWMLQHFQVVYRTAYYCPYSNPNSHPNCYSATNLPTADADAQRYNGSADTSASSYFSGGEAMLEYYAGQPLLGTVQLPDGKAVPGARVTVYDSWGIPHMTTTTGADGSFQLLMPPGNVTVNVTTGAFDALSQADTTNLATLHYTVSPVYAQSDTPVPIVQQVTLRSGSINGFVYLNAANNTTYNPQLDHVLPGAQVHIAGPGSISENATTDPSGAFVLSDLPPGVYQFSVNFQDRTYNQTEVYLSPGQVANQTVGIPAGLITGTVQAPLGYTASGATVTVDSAQGVVTTITADAKGNFTIQNLPPGNYTALARVAAQELASPSVAFSVSTAGGSTAINLTMSRVVTVSLTVLQNGAPVGGFPVRFSPVLSPQAYSTTGNSTHTPTVNSTAYLTAANGSLTASVPVGNYTVYGAGLIGTGLYAGFESAYLTNVAPSLTLAPLVLSPGYTVQGYTPPPGGGYDPNTIIISVYTPRGDVLTAHDNISGNWMLVLPAGVYGLSATLPSSTAGGVNAAMTSLTVPSSGTVDLTLGPAIVFTTRVGAMENGSSSSLYPAAGALVSLTAENGQGFISALTDANGSLALVYPSMLSNPNFLYCLNVTAPGFEPFGQCGLRPPQLPTFETIPLTLTPISFNLTINGLPYGLPVTINVSASAAPASTVHLTGGPTFSTQLVPGSYEVTGWAQLPRGQGVLRLPSPIPINLPFGFSSENLTLTLFRQVGTTGVLRLPSGLSASAVSVHLTSPGLSQNLTGTAFTSYFLASPGTYTLLASATVGNTTYANLTTVSVNSTGAVSPAIDLQIPGGLLQGVVLTGAGQLLNQTVLLNLTTPSGLSLSVPVIHGAFTADLPTGLVVTPSLNITIPTPAGNVTRYTTYTIPPGTSCPVTANSSTCTITLTGRALLSGIEGTVHFGSYTGGLNGTATFLGPLPSQQLVSVPVSSSGFSVSVMPGEYDVYVTTGPPGAVLGTVAQVVIPYAPNYALPLTLSHTWVDSLTLLAGASHSASSATLTFSSATGTTFTYPSVALNSPLDLALPVGVWTFTANSTARPYGPEALTSASATVALMAGNAATRLTLVPAWIHQVSFSIVGANSATVPGGGEASFSFVLHNLGNLPYTVHLQGSPSSWTFNFTPQNLSLGVDPSNSTVTGEVVIHVPVGTLVAHEPVVLEALTPDGNAVGVVSPSPTVNVLPSYQLRMGGSPNLGTAAPTESVVSFWVLNPGNVPVSVSLGVSNLAQLRSISWNAVIEQGTTPVSGPVSIAAGTNSSYEVRLTAPPNTAILPGNVTVVATVLNGSGAITLSTTLAIPQLSIGISNGTLIVTGPSIGSAPAYPDWIFVPIAFAPAVAVAITLVTYRWWRTRRWTRK
jgi:dolichyl-diphosphooligosaccharide--protein glycosyltransferase